MPGAEDFAAGMVELTLTTTGNETCPPASDVLVILLPNSFSGSGTTSSDALCNGAGSGSATVVPALDGFTFLWDDPAAQATATASGLAAGTYTVQVMDSHGCDTVLTASVGEPAAITIASLTAQAEGCLGEGNGGAAVMAAGGTGPYTYLWSNGANTASIIATSGTYSVSVTDANGCAPANGEITIVPEGLPNEALAGPDLVGCLDALPISLTGTVVNATGGIWSGGQGLFQANGLEALYMPTVAEVQAGSVELVLTTTGNDLCPPDQDTLTIVLSNSFLSTSLTPQQVDCHGNANGSISAWPAEPWLTYLWNDPAAQTTALVDGLGPGTWTVTITDTLGCDTTLSALITEPPALVLDSLISEDITCPGGNNGMAAVYISGGTPGYQSQWSGNGQLYNGIAVSALHAGTWTVTVTDAAGCSISGSVELEMPPPITLTATVPDTVCINAPVLLEAQAEGGNGGITITWNSIGTGDAMEHSFGSSQNVLVSAIDQAGCAGPQLSLPVYVLDLGQAQLSTSGGGTFCPGDSTLVAAQLNGYPGVHTIDWSMDGLAGEGPFPIPVTATMDITATVTDACGQVLQGTVAIVLETPPAVLLPPVIAEGCAPLAVQFPTSLTDQPVSWLWDLGDGNTSTQAAPQQIYQEGTYTPTLTVTTPAGCTAMATGAGLVIVHAGPTAAFSANMWSSDMDAPTFTFTDGSTGDIATWTWYFGDGGSGSGTPVSHTYAVPGTHTVLLLVEDVYGCTDEVMHDVHLDPVHEVIIPNAFTPNPNGGGGGGQWVPNDLSNDVFYPFADHVKEMRMRIFNRWGELIFESTDPAIGWDGYYRGQLSPQDVYVYQVWVKFVDDKEVMRLGDLTLFR
jgi:gliding motility-associated-like protein